MAPFELMMTCAVGATHAYQLVTANWSLVQVVLKKKKTLAHEMLSLLQTVFIEIEPVRG